MSLSADLPETDLVQTARIIEALVFASTKAVSVKSILPYLKDETQLPEIIDMIQSRYDERSGLRFEVSGDQMAFRTKDDVARYLSLDRPVQKPLSRAALEVLAIIAYHQPITRSEIEEIRGISLSRGTLDILLELEWVKPRGRRRTPGRPLTWGTSPAFLDHFGLSSVEDLPGMDELKSAGLLRKGQILGGLGELASEDGTDEDTDDLLDETDLLDTEFEDQFADEFESDTDED
ncbi:MAG: SMC-Scp complex subunit ScpB [Candidatus Puniceispirillaceae bacterium]|nr:SMC-Scp complex subunit ScpB [Alphaproteobacteria bacterium]